MNHYFVALLLKEIKENPKLKDWDVTSSYIYNSDFIHKAFINFVDYKFEVVNEIGDELVVLETYQSLDAAIGHIVNMEVEK